MDSILTAQNISDLLHNPAIWLLIVWITREAFFAYKKKGVELDKTIKDCTNKMAELTIAIVRLEARMENIEAMTYAVPKLKEDVNNLFRKVRTFDPGSGS